MNVEVCIKDNVFTSNVTSIICTDIYIACNGICFPSNDWNDFTDILLGTWAHVMLEKRYKRNKTFELYFMDGSYRMIVHKDKDMQLTVSCIEDRWDME